MEKVRNRQQTQDCTQWRLTALPPLGCDSRIFTRAQAGKAKRPLVCELVGAFRELQYTRVPAWAGPACATGRPELQRR